MEIRRTVCFVCLVACIAVAQNSTRPPNTSSESSPAGQQVGNPQSETLDSIVSRMEEAQEINREHCRAYTMTRDYKLLSGDDKSPKSEVVAELTFVPPHQKSFTIDKAEGSGRGISIVRDVLKHETEAAKRSDAPGAVTRKNYSFALLGETEVDGQPSWILQLTPLHEETTLIRGKAWVDKNTYLVHRLDGDLAKNPSWWLKRVHATISYGNAAGMWLQVATYAVADVRIIGPHIFDSRVTDLQTADEVSHNFSSVPPDYLAAASIRTVNRTASAAVRTRPRRLGSVPAIIGAGVVR